MSMILHIITPIIIYRLYNQYFNSNYRQLQPSKGVLLLLKLYTQSQ